MATSYVPPQSAKQLAESPEWLPIIAGDRQRLLAAEAYFAAKSAGADKAARRQAALDAVGISIGDFRGARARAAAEKRAAAKTAASEQREKAAAQFAKDVEAAREPLERILDLALKHEETCRWFNLGSWTWRNWEIRRTGSTPWGNNRSPARAANMPAYDALVSIIRRRAWNRGRGDRRDISPETPNDPARVAFARAIIAREPVPAESLLDIEDAHARAWAIEQTGGVERIAAALPVIEATDAGTLRDGAAAGLVTDVLEVVCPSTGRAYFLGVERPRQARYRTVRRALRSINGIEGSRLVAQA